VVAAMQSVVHSPRGTAKVINNGLRYRIAGKTGTAQIAGEYGYDPRWTIASFIGWGPLPNPRFMILVKLDKPESSPWGSVVAAPVFQELAERVVVLLNLPPDPALMPVAGAG